MHLSCPNVVICVHHIHMLIHLLSDVSQDDFFIIDMAVVMNVAQYVYLGYIYLCLDYPGVRA